MEAQVYFFLTLEERESDQNDDDDFEIFLFFEVAILEEYF